MVKALLIIAFLLWAVPAWGQSLTLTWQDNSNNEDGFRVQRKLGPTGTFADLANVGANVTTHLDTTTLAGTEYCYRVAAFNIAGASGLTNEACATPKAVPIDPTGLTVIQIQTQTTIVITPP